MTFELPPEYDEILNLAASQPDHVRAIWRYALVLAMIDDEKAQVVETSTEDGHAFIRVRTVVGDEFLVERPAMSADSEHMLLERVRSIIEVDRAENASSVEQ